MRNSLKDLKSGVRMMPTGDGKKVPIDLDTISCFLYDYLEYEKVGVIYSEIDKEDGNSIVEFIRLLEYHKLFNEYRLMYCKTKEDREMQSIVLADCKNDLKLEFQAWLNKYFYGSFGAFDLEHHLSENEKSFCSIEGLRILSKFMIRIAKKIGYSNVLKSSLLKRLNDEI